MKKVLIADGKRRRKELYCVPDHLVEPVMKHLHEATHCGRGSLTTYVKQWLTGPGISRAIRKVIARCVVCRKNNPEQIPIKGEKDSNAKASVHVRSAKQTVLRCQGSESGNICLSLLTPFLGWIKAYPTRMETSLEAVNALLKEIIPHFGLPGSIQSDNGPAFVSEITQKVSKFEESSGDSTRHGDSGFWEGREDESHPEEKCSQAVLRNSSASGSSLAYCPAQDKGGSSKWDSVESL